MWNTVKDGAGNAMNVAWDAAKGVFKDAAGNLIDEAAARAKGWLNGRRVRINRRALDFSGMWHTVKDGAGNMMNVAWDATKGVFKDAAGNLIDEAAARAKGWLNGRRRRAAYIRPPVVVRRRMFLKR